MLVAAAACRTAPPPATEPEPLVGLVAADLGTQRLFRVEARGPEGRSSLRLVLRLWRADRFEATASDALGRALWALEVDGERARWRDPRSDESCVLGADAPLDLPRFELPLAARELPAVLLGRLPSAAAGATVAAAGEWLDESGRRGTFRTAAGVLVDWKLAAAGVELARWRRAGAGAELELDGGQLELAWREAAREPLRAPAPAWRSRSGEAECGDATLS